MAGEFSRATCALIDERDGGRCQKCGIDLLGRRFSRHHRIPRGMGGSKDPKVSRPSNGLLLCGTGVDGCHGEVESNRDEARKLGFLVRSGGEPTLQPVITFRGPRYLTDDGESLTLAEMAEAVGA